MKIFIDAGHGGVDSGAVGHGIYEKNVTLEISKRVEYHLKRHSQTVIMSRNGDDTVGLSERSNLANANKCDIAVSIHCNAFNGSAKGVETYTHGKQEKQLKLANAIHNNIMSDNLYTINRGIKQANFHMLRQTSMTSVLLELAFIDNEQDVVFLKNNKERFAIAIAKGILNYFNIAWKDENSHKENAKPEDKTLYIVSVGAYSDKKNAENMVNELKKKGYNCYIHTCI